MLDNCLAKVAHRVTGVLHIGAHTGQEAPIYEKHGVTNVVWIEANPKVIPQLRANVEPLGHRVIEAAVWSGGNGALMPLNISNNEGMSSSLLEFETHRRRHPSVHYVETIQVQAWGLTQLAALHDLRGLNFLTADIQGTESAALSDCPFLRQVDFIFAEVSFEPLYRWSETADMLENHIPQFTCTSLEAHCPPGKPHDIFSGNAFYERFRHSALDLRARI